MPVIPFPTTLADLERRAQVLISPDAVVWETLETGELIIRTGLKLSASDEEVLERMNNG